MLESVCAFRYAHIFSTFRLLSVLDCTIMILIWLCFSISWMKVRLSCPICWVLNNHCMLRTFLWFVTVIRHDIVRKKLLLTTLLPHTGFILQPALPNVVFRRTRGADGARECFCQCWSCVWMKPRGALTEKWPMTEWLKAVPFTDWWGGGVFERSNVFLTGHHLYISRCSILFFLLI